MAAPLVNAIQFFRDFGLFDVILPFLLVFSIMFAILEKTRILGEEKIKDISMPKRSLNAMVSFVIAMLVVATNKIVTAINTALPNIVFLAVVILSFLMLLGIFYKEGDFDFAGKSHTKWMFGFSVVILVAIVAIFADSLTTSTGQTWLDWFFTYVGNNFTGPVVTSIIFLIVTLLAIWFIMSKPAGEKK